MSNGIDAIKQKAALIKDHLPTCFDGYSVLPNTFCGNSLFAGTGGRKKSLIHKNKDNAQVEVKSASKKYQIYYTGEQLAQSDLSFYLRLIPLYSVGKTKLGDNCWINLHEFLVEGYSSLNSQAYEAFMAKVIRLYSTEVVIVRPDIPPYYCRLISGRSDVFHGKNNKKMIEITLDPILKEAFQIDGYSFINLTERLSLGNNQLALWIHTYYARHAKPHPITAQFIYEKSGSLAKDFTRWVRCTLTPAVEKINAFNNWTLHLETNFGVEKAKLFCNSKPKTASQEKYLEQRSEW